MNIFKTLSIFLVSTNIYAGMFFLDDDQQSSVDYNFDPYYSHVAINYDRTQAEILPSEAEADLYVYLLKNFYKFKSFRLEGSINPLPMFGSYLKSDQSEFYNKAYYGEFNLIKAFTEGFPEPYALSLFMGSKIYLGNEAEGITGFGLGGFLASVGTHHIVNNETFRDNWIEMEIKLKGGAITPHGKLTYSYRGGIKLHSEKNIRNTTYFGIKRSHSDNRVKHWSFFKNTEIDLRGDLALDDLEITRLMGIVGKKYPSDDKKRIYSLDLGFIWVRGKGYTGSIADTLGDPGFSVLIRPNVSF